MDPALIKSEENFDPDVGIRVVIRPEGIKDKRSLTGIDRKEQLSVINPKTVLSRHSRPHANPIEIRLYPAHHGSRLAQSTSISHSGAECDGGAYQ